MAELVRASGIDSQSPTVGVHVNRGRSLQETDRVQESVGEKGAR
jgi:formylmethanofuran dehydrogenase subunit A